MDLCFMCSYADREFQRIRRRGGCRNTEMRCARMVHSVHWFEMGLRILSVFFSPRYILRNQHRRMSQRSVSKRRHLQRPNQWIRVRLRRWIPRPHLRTGDGRVRHQSEPVPERRQMRGSGGRLRVRLHGGLRGEELWD